MHLFRAAAHICKSKCMYLLLFLFLNSNLKDKLEQYTLQCTFDCLMIYCLVCNSIICDFTAIYISVKLDTCICLELWHIYENLNVAFI